MRATAERAPMLVLDQHRIAAPDFPRGPEWWFRFLPDWITAEHRDGGILILGVSDVPHPSQPPKPVAAVRRSREKAALHWLHNLPQLEPAIVEEKGGRCPCWRGPCIPHGGHCCFTTATVCHSLPEDMRAADEPALISRRAEAWYNLHRRYGIKFCLDSDGTEPTDANLARVLAGCARRPRPDEYPQIRRHVAEYRAGTGASDD